MQTRTLASVAAAVLFACGGSKNPGIPGSVAGNGPAGAPDGGPGSQLPPPAMAIITVTFSGTGSGRVTSAPIGIDCPGSCSIAVPVGTAVTLTPQPDATSSFIGWGGACSGTSCSFVAAGGASTAFINFMANATTVDDCAGLVPAPPGQVSGSFSASPLTFANSADPTICMPGFADGDGSLALQISDGHPGAGHETNFLSPEGALLGSALDGEVTITEQADGFIDSNFDGQVSLIRYDSNAGRAAVTDKFDTVRAIANDPTGGVVALRMEPAGSVDVLTSVVLSAYDAHLAPRWRATLPAEPVAIAAVDRAGNTLVIIDGDDRYGARSVAAIWVDHSGNVGAEFKLSNGVPGGSPAHNATFVVAERVGSGLFVGAGSSWLAQLDTLSTSPDAPPAWLASRLLSNLHVVHGGQGYAVLPRPSRADCAQTIEIVSASGRTCGLRTFRAASGLCTTDAIRVGYDGTVVQQVPAPPRECAWQWWSGYFH